jgi:hypothetical protein
MFCSKEGACVRGVDEHVGAAGPEVVRIGPPGRPRTDIEAWNVGLISARRPELTPAENLIRDAELRAKIRQYFGLFHLRGQYVGDYGLPHAKTMEEYACFVSSHPDDSGNLKGFLRKCGRKYGQDSVIYKGYYRDAVRLTLYQRLAACESSDAPAGPTNATRRACYLRDRRNRGCCLANNAAANWSGRYLGRCHQAGCNRDEG